MIARIAAASLALAAALAWGAQAVLSSAEQASCDVQGGCVFVTMDALRGKMRAAFEAGVKEGGRECRKPTT